MYSTKNLPPILQPLGQSYLESSIAIEFGIDKLDGLVRWSEEARDDVMHCLLWSDKLRFIKEMFWLYGANDIIGFGENKDKKFRDVSGYQVYLYYYIQNVPQFLVKQEFLIELSNQGYNFPDDVILAYKKKRSEYHAASLIRILCNNVVKEHREAEEDYKWEQPRRNEYYNDDLDMDQQSQEHWDNS